MVSDIEIMNKGIRCLLEKLGVVETVYCRDQQGKI